ncbi:MAG: hypothetical protein A2Z75_08705 [Chloroflexi bacterium RBG_13_50_10]|nr:MAG: hypothetical protein A2Z75_08705 [Chloroflexi bacterium RBG_13_50_10]
MKKWSIPVIVAILALLMPVYSATANAQDEAGLSISKSADPVSAAVGGTITYTYTISNSDNFTIENVSLVDDKLGTIDLGGQTNLGAGENIIATATHTVVEADLPGPIENTATVSGTDPDGNSVTANVTASVVLTYTASLQLTKTADPSPAAPHQTITYTYTITNNSNVTTDNLSLQDDKLGAISLTDTTLAPGESLTATATYTVTTADLPGPIVNTATVSGNDSTGQSISVTSDQVSVSLYINKWLLFKAEILKLMGVRGKGIEKAPGLQKPFNPKSQAAEHAGKKDKDQDQEEEQLRIRERVENQGTEEQLQIRSEVQNQTGSGQATQGDDEAKPEKWQLKKNWGTDNQTGEQEATDNGHKPDKDKPNNKSKAGK